MPASTFGMIRMAGDSGSLSGVPWLATSETLDRDASYILIT